MHAVERTELGHRAGEGHVDGVRAQVSKLGEGPLVDEPAVAEDADAIADRLHLAEDVRREEDRLPTLLRLEHGLTERHLHQRVEPARRLVKDQQVGSRRERRNELHLLPVSLRQRADLPIGVELEPLHQ